MSFEPYHMDKRELLRFNADLDNPHFQDKYNRWRQVWTNHNIRAGEMSRELLFLLAEEFQKKPSAATPDTEVKASDAKPKKALQPA